MPRRKGLYPKFLSVVISQRLHEELVTKAAAREESMGSLVRTLIREGMASVFPERPERADREAPQDVQAEGPA